MKVIERNTVAEWLNWTETEAGVLVAEERDVRATLRSGLCHFGSLAVVSSRWGEVVLLTYGAPSVRTTIDVITLTKLEIFNSRRLRAGEAYRQMGEMMSIVRRAGH